ncbi:hypothetical protein POTOM_033900 [Populus tomentosa]|uniref:Uncharacterized protein n=1 Tax=Populus tomentosa TaxID=118781 RepID=A0A8X7ZC45_POPTO|nr:hypothetical protein POTOM_033900 [Populus tomentosa]
MARTARDFVEVPTPQGRSMTFISIILKKLNEDRDHQDSKMSDALERVCLFEEASSSLVQSYRVLKVKMVAFKTEMATTKAEARASREEYARLRALSYLFNEFLTMFGGSQALNIFIRDKIFQVMSNLHFYHLSRGIIMDFLMAFNLKIVPDFDDIYPTWVVIATRDEYLAKELDK